MMESSQTPGHLIQALCRDTMLDWDSLFFGPTDLFSDSYLHTPLISSVRVSPGLLKAVSAKTRIQTQALGFPTLKDRRKPGVSPESAPYIIM